MDEKELLRQQQIDEFPKRMNQKALGILLAEIEIEKAERARTGQKTPFKLEQDSIHEFWIKNGIIRCSQYCHWPGHPERQPWKSESEPIASRDLAEPKKEKTKRENLRRNVTESGRCPNHIGWCKCRG